ncbi:MAG: hypothetical protein ACJA0H_001085 [Francisellaceae bacterium]|jgi:hypothetical protein
MALHPRNIDAIDTIDAMVFSGDSLTNAEDREAFKENIESWLREIQNFEKLAAELQV